MGLPMRALHRGEKPVCAVAVHPDGTRVAAAGADGAIRIWETKTGREIRVLRLPGVAISLEFNASGSLLLAAGAKGPTLLDIETRRAVPLLGHRGRVWTAVFGPRGKTVVTAGADRTAKVWDLTKKNWDGAIGVVVATFELDWSGIRGAHLSPDGRRIAAISATGMVAVWDLKTMKMIRKLGAHSGGSSIRFSSNGKLLFTTGGDGAARIWEIESGRLLANLAERRGVVLSSAFSPDGTLLITAHEDGSVVVWGAASGLPLAVTSAHSGPALAARFSPDGELLVTSGSDGRVLLWDVGLTSKSAVEVAH